MVLRITGEYVSDYGHDGHADALRSWHQVDNQSLHALALAISTRT